MNNIRFFYLKIFIFSVVKFLKYLNRRVFVMSILNVEVSMPFHLYVFFSQMVPFMRNLRNV